MFTRTPLLTKCYKLLFDMYTYRTTTDFENGLRHCLRDLHKDVQVLKDALEILTEEGQLPESYKPHKLRDKYAGLWECHLEDDWLLVWRQNDKHLTLLLTNTGTHEELFKKK